MQQYQQYNSFCTIILNPNHLCPQRRDDANGLQIKFVDFDWGGKAGQIMYPPFMNDRINWAVSDPVGKPIEQKHDIEMLKRCLAECNLRKAGQEQCHGQKRPREA